MEKTSLEEGLGLDKGVLVKSKYAPFTFIPKEDIEKRTIEMDGIAYELKGDLKDFRYTDKEKDETRKTVEIGDLVVSAEALPNGKLVPSYEEITPDNLSHIRDGPYVGRIVYTPSKDLCQKIMDECLKNRLKGSKIDPETPKEKSFKRKVLDYLFGK